jgi:murein DD-endopeptidase MepM/ murein hydrolase activator NlpD
MRQRPLFQSRRRPTRLIRRSLLAVAIAAIAATILWQLMPPPGDSSSNDEPTSPGEIPIELVPADEASAREIQTADAGGHEAPDLVAAATPVDTRLPAIEAAGADERGNTDDAASAAEGSPDTAGDSLQTRTVTVNRGDTLSTIFERAGLGYSDVLAVLDLGDEARRLERIRPGETLVLMTDDSERLAGLKYDLDQNSELDIFREDGEKLVARINDLPSETRLVSAGGRITGSLYQSAIATGVPPAQVMQLAEIFGWKIDFLRDVRDGDQFRLIYEVRERDGERLGAGQVVAAEFVNRGESVKAVRYTSPEGSNGYYEPDGASLERGFLRYPVEFSRISSNFNPARLHPIHNTVRPHNGVDLAAPTGTPIRAAGTGRVTFIGWKHGYGKVIQIRHDAKYETVYAHMSRFKSRLKRGAKVEKGEVIGYVGMTGAATGPHLHYELKVHGKPYDPVKVELPEANAIASKNRQDFLDTTQPALEQLARIKLHIDGEQTVHLARNHGDDETDGDTSSR